MVENEFFLFACLPVCLSFCPLFTHDKDSGSGSGSGSVSHFGCRFGAPMLTDRGKIVRMKEQDKDERRDERNKGVWQSVKVIAIAIATTTRISSVSDVVVVVIAIVIVKGMTGQVH